MEEEDKPAEKTKKMWTEEWNQQKRQRKSEQKEANQENGISGRREWSTASNAVDRVK